MPSAQARCNELPSTNDDKKKKVTADGFANKFEEKVVRMKVQAVLFIMVFVIPGNLVTLIIYTTSEGNKIQVVRAIS